MARQRRDLNSSTWFHVFNRGADRQDIFSSDGDHRLFEELVAEAIERHPVELHAYAQMTNHFHLLLHCPDGHLSEFVQRACGRYGAAYNQRSQREGPLVSGRFHSKPIANDGQLIAVARYIHRNPLAFVTKERLTRYPWSSLSSLCGARVAPPWLCMDPTSRGGMSAADYLDFVLTDVPSDADNARCSAERWEPRRIALPEVDRAVARAAGVDAGELHVVDRGRRNAARTVAITLAVDLRTAPHEDIGDWYDLADVRSVRRVARRGRVLIAQDPRAATLYAAARANLAPFGV